MKNLRLLVIISLSLTLVFGCKEEKSSTAIVTVLEDATDAPVAGATVRLYYANAMQPTTVDVTAVTDGAGRATYRFDEHFELGQAGLFVLDIEVNGTIVGVIKVEEETTSEEVVRI